MDNDATKTVSPTLDKRTAKLVNAILRKKIAYDEIPPESELNPAVIQAEFSAGYRKITKCGYDVIRNLFFVDVTVNPNSHYPNVQTESFSTFGEFFTYLHGDIYHHSSFYQYVFSEKEIKDYQIDLSRIKRGPFSNSTIDDVVSKITLEKDREYNKGEVEKDRLLSVSQKIINSASYKEFRQLIRNNTGGRHRTDIDFYLSRYINKKGQDALKFLVPFVNEQDGFPAGKAEGLCYFFDPKKLVGQLTFNGLPSTKYHRRTSLRNFANSLEKQEIQWTHRYYFDSRTHLFVDCIFGKKAEKILATTNIYFENLKDFGIYRNFDLSKCDLSSARIGPNDLQNFRRIYKSVAGEPA
jgi:hypothetical protein